MPIESINLSSTKKSDFVPTQEELRTIQEKMKDPEFMKLMTEYMNSLEDPAYRKEEEEYLAQVEREAKESGDNSFDFVFPKPNYFVELLQGVGKDKEGSRVFINMCTSEKIEEYKEETTNRRDASNWTVPVSIGRPRPDTFEGKPACVYDAVFHPKTLSLSDRSDRFMTFLVEIAVENINAGHKKQYGYGYRRMSNSSSKVISVGTPQNMTVSRPKGAGNGGGKSIFDLAKEQSVLTKPTQFNADGTTVLSEASRGAGSSGGGTAGYTPSSSSTSASNTTVVSGAERGNGSSKAAATSTPSATASAATATPKENLPPYSITHRGVVDLLDTWNWKVSDKRTGVPKQLVVTATFAGVTSAAALEMDVSEDGYRIDIHKTAKHPFFGSIVLPFTVEDTPSSAKFDKKKCILTLVLDVKSTTIPLADLPKSDASDENRETEVATNEKESEPEARVSDEKSLKEASPIEVQSAAPSASPARNAHANPSINKEEGEETAQTETKQEMVSKVEEEEIKVASEEKQQDDEAEKEEEEETATRTQLRDTAVAADVLTSPKSEEGYEADANDRMQEVMRKIAEAKRQREEAERIEREAEEAVREAEEAEKQKQNEEEKQKNAFDESKSSEEKDEASAEKDSAICTDAEPVEVVDLRNRQAEWLKGVKSAAVSNNDERSSSLTSGGAENEEGKAPQSFNEALASAVRAVVEDSTTSGGLLSDLENDEDEESLAKKREMKRKLREIQRQEEAAREAERLDSLMKQKMAELPLRCRHIFEIE